MAVARRLAHGGGRGCPVCAGKTIVTGENDLAHLQPEIAAQWDKRKNGCLKPSDVAVSSNRPARWRCELGHSYRATVSSRTQRKTGCPYCAGRKVLKGFNDLKTLCPGVAAQWHPSLNGALTPEMVTRGVTLSSTKFAPLPSCDKTNSIKTIKAAESDVLSAALLFA